MRSISHIIACTLHGLFSGSFGGLQVPEVASLSAEFRIEAPILVETADLAPRATDIIRGILADIWNVTYQVILCPVPTVQYALQALADMVFTSTSFKAPYNYPPSPHVIPYSPPNIPQILLSQPLHQRRGTVSPRNVGL